MVRIITAPGLDVPGRWSHENNGGSGRSFKDRCAVLEDSAEHLLGFRMKALLQVILSIQRFFCRRRQTVTVCAHISSV